MNHLNYTRPSQKKPHHVDNARGLLSLALLFMLTVFLWQLHVTQQMLARRQYMLTALHSGIKAASQNNTNLAEKLSQKAASLEGEKFNYLVIPSTGTSKPNPYDTETSALTANQSSDSTGSTPTLFLLENKADKYKLSWRRLLGQSLIIPCHTSSTNHARTSQFTCHDDNTTVSSNIVFGGNLIVTNELTADIRLPLYLGVTGDMSANVMNIKTNKKPMPLAIIASGDIEIDELLMTDTVKCQGYARCLYLLSSKGSVVIKRINSPPPATPPANPIPEEDATPELPNSLCDKWQSLLAIQAAHQVNICGKTQPSLSVGHSTGAASGGMTWEEVMDTVTTPFEAIGRRQG